MNIILGTYRNVNYDIRKGDLHDFEAFFSFFDSVCGDTPIDLTGWTKVFEVVDHFGNIVFTKNTFLLLSSDTNLLHPSEYRYRMTLISPLGAAYTFIQGYLRIKSNLT